MALVENVKRNRAANVRAVNAAAAGSRGTVQIYSGTPDNIGGKSIIPRHGPAEASVESFPLPDLLGPKELGRAALIKIDVEGAESTVLRGILDCPQMLGPTTDIIVEMTPDWLSEENSAERLLAEFRAFGYEAYELRTHSIEEYFKKPAHSRPRRIGRTIVNQTDVLLTRRSIPAD